MPQSFDPGAQKHKMSIINQICVIQQKMYMIFRICLYLGFIWQSPWWFLLSSCMHGWGASSPDGFSMVLRSEGQCSSVVTLPKTSVCHVPICCFAAWLLVCQNLKAMYVKSINQYQVNKFYKWAMSLPHQQKSTIVIPYKRSLGYIGITLSVCLSVCLSICLSRVNLALAITFELKEIKLSYYTCVYLVTRPFSRYQKCWPYDLDLDFLTFFWKKKT